MFPRTLGEHVDVIPILDLWTGAVISAILSEDLIISSLAHGFMLTSYVF